MNSEQDGNMNLIDTTDCLEAVSVFRGWKNFLFIVVIVCLVLLQASFWLVDIGYVKIDKLRYGKSPAAERCPKQADETMAESKEKIEQAAEKAAATDKVGESAAQPQPETVKDHFRIKFKHIAWFILFVNFVLVLTAILYCLTMLFALKISLVGRLGGINHISRAFFISLVFLVLLLPWQIPWHKFFAGELVGAMYTPKALLSSFAALEERGAYYQVFYYFRFSGYWLIVLLPLIFSYIRSCRWARTILRRLEVV